MATDADNIKNMKDAPELDTATFNEFTSWFKFLDKDGNGKLDREEFKKALRAMGWNPSDEEVNAVWDVTDADGNGFIDEQEYLKLLEMLRKDPAEEKAALREAFRKFDRSKTGELTRSQMKQCFMRLNCWIGDLCGSDLDALLDRADKNKDGVISIDEFVDVMLEKP